MSNIPAESLLSLTERIVDSGSLGRSKKYGAILRYLVDCTIKGQTPKEASIAIDVLGKDESFDVSKDSIVRVHIHHLRNRLKDYFQKNIDSEDYILEIPLGQYIVQASEVQESIGSENSNATSVRQNRSSITGKSLNRKPVTPWLAGTAIVLLLLNLIFSWTSQDPLEEALSIPENAYSSLTPWQSILDDEQPITLVIGDYYIFGQIDDSGNVTRMVREFNINSPADLAAAESQFSQQGLDYLDLGLSYIPVSVASSINELMNVLGSNSDRVTVKMVSELNTRDLASNHIIYLGFLSGLDTLLDLMFAASTFSIGLTYDEIINLDTQDHYIGSSGLSAGQRSYEDYGLVSAFTSPNGHQFLLIAGMRDQGLINIAEQMTDRNALKELENRFEQGMPKNFEALFKVTGFDNTNFGGEVIEVHSLDQNIIWETQLINQQ